MGNIFDGATEDLILYWVIPSSLVVFVLVVAGVLFRVRTLFRRRAASWDTRVEAPTPDYRHAAKEPAGAPQLVRRAAYVLVVWGFLNAASCVACLLLLGLVTRLGVFVPLSALSLALVFQAARGAFDMTDRFHPDVSTHIPNSRIRVGIIQSCASCVGTAFGLFAGATTLFTWNGHGEMAVLLITLAYAAFSVLPTLLGIWLFRALLAISPLYAASPKESAAHAT